MLVCKRQYNDWENSLSLLCNRADFDSKGNKALLQSLKELLTHSLIYGLGNLAVTGVAVLFVPLYTNAMTLAEYSKLEILTVAISTMSLIGPLGIGSAIVKMLASDCETESDRRQLIGAALLFVVLVNGAFALLTGTIARSLAIRFLDGPQDVVLVILALLTVNANIINAAGLSVFRAQMQPRRYAMFSFSRFVVAVGCNIWFIVGLGWGVKGAVLGNMIGAVCVTCILLPLMAFQSRLQFSFEWLRRLLGFGLPLVPSSTGWSLLRIGERVLLQTHAAAGEVGLYGLGYKFGQVVGIGFVSPFSLAWPPIYFSMLKEENGKEKYVLILTYLCLVGAWVVLAVSLLAPIAIQLLSPPEYLAAYRVVPLIAMAQLLHAIYYGVAASLHIVNKTIYFPFLNFVPAIGGLALDIWLIPHYGMEAAAFSMFFAFALRLGILFYLTHRFFPVQYEWGRVAKITLAGIGLYNVCALVPVVSPLYPLVAFTGLALYPLILYVCRFFSAREVQRVRSMVIAKWQRV